MAAEELGLEIAVKGFAKFLSDMKSADKAIDGTEKRWSGLSKIAGGAGKALAGAAKIGLTAIAAGGVAAVGAITGLAVGLGKLAIEAAPLEGIGTAFEAMSQRVGLSLESLRDASLGTISNFELMRSANVALTGAGETLGQEFGKKLPGLLEIARASAKATGQDVGFMFNSLVTGVKRTSPMLIDNTGLQLKLGEANQNLADQLGKTVAELTGEEKQIALLNATLAAGQVMVDEFGGGQLTAAERMAQFRATVQNTKDQIGLALLPALERLLVPLSDLAQEWGPRVIEWAQLAGEWLAEKLPQAIATLSGWWEQTWPKIQATLVEIWAVVQPILAQVVSWLQENLPVAIQTLSEFWETTLQPALQQVWAFISENIIPILAGLVAMILAIVIPAFIAWVGIAVPAAAATVAALWPIITPIVAIGAAVALLVAAWQRDWGGIRTFLTEVWEGKLKPIFEMLKEWLATNIPIAIETLRGFWETVLLPALQTIWRFIQNSIIPIFEVVVAWLQENIPVAIQTLSDFWTNVLQPALEIVWGFIQDNLVPLFEALTELAEVTLSKALEVLAGVWQNILQPALEAVWAFIQDNIIPIFNEVKKVVEETLGPPLKELGETILPIVQGAFDNIGSAIQTVIGWIKDLTTKIASIELPDWLKPGSATPFELGLRGIADALRQVNALGFGGLTAALQTYQPVGIVGTAGGPSQFYDQRQYNYNLTTQSLTRPGGLRLEFAALEMASR